MREIKFRAWDDKKKIMIRAGMLSPRYLRFSGKSVLCVSEKLTCLGGGYSLNTEEDLKIMQYTGLNDKNGIEIYEGDIVLIDWLEGDNSHIDKVEWSKSDACWDFGAGTTSEVNWSHLVIGNIYESHELLESKQ